MRLMKEGVEDTSKWRVYEASKSETSVKHDARLRYKVCVSDCFGVDQSIAWHELAYKAIHVPSD